jgi:hypothetical protein
MGEEVVNRQCARRTWWCASKSRKINNRIHNDDGEAWVRAAHRRLFRTGHACVLATCHYIWCKVSHRCLNYLDRCRWCLNHERLQGRRTWAHPNVPACTAHLSSELSHLSTMQQPSGSQSDVTVGGYLSAESAGRTSKAAAQRHSACKWRGLTVPPTLL